jgi:hypothetical protein
MERRVVIKKAGVPQNDLEISDPGMDLPLTREKICHDHVIKIVR